MKTNYRLSFWFNFLDGGGRVAPINGSSCSWRPAESVGCQVGRNKRKVAPSRPLDSAGPAPMHCLWFENNNENLFRQGFNLKKKKVISTLKQKRHFLFPEWSYQSVVSTWVSVFAFRETGTRLKVIPASQANAIQNKQLTWKAPKIIHNGVFDKVRTKPGDLHVENQGALFQYIGMFWF